MKSIGGVARGPQPWRSHVNGAENVRAPYAVVSAVSATVVRRFGSKHSLLTESPVKEAGSSPHKRSRDGFNG